MDGLTPEIFLVTCILIETGCRHGEVIRLDDAVPHIRVAERDDREHKTNSFSAAASAAFSRRKLFETQDHVIYSFRHAFEDRMKEAGIDFELRMLLMGHDNRRPEYGTGGSMKYRQLALEKIMHPFPDDFFAAFDASRTE